MVAHFPCRAHLLICLARYMYGRTVTTIRGGEFNVRNNTLIRLLMATALLIFAIPVVASAQNYDRYRYDRGARGDVRDAIQQLDNASVRLENDLSRTRGRRVLGLFWVTNTDSAAVAQVRDFRSAVRQLRRASANGRDLRSSYDEAQVVVDQGMQLDRYLRLRTGRTDVDFELSEIRSSVHVIAEAYGMNPRF